MSKYIEALISLKVPNRWISELLDYWITVLLDYWITVLLDYWITVLLDYWITPKQATVKNNKLLTNTITRFELTRNGVRHAVSVP